MSDDCEEFWAALPEQILHPARVLVVEALWWIGQPLSAIALVDVLDGYLSMWEALHHLRALEALGVAEVEPASGDLPGRRDVFDAQYRLKAHDADGH